MISSNEDSSFLQNEDYEAPTSKTSTRDRFQKINANKSLEESESTEDWLKRNAYQNVARDAEMYLGMPGGFKKAFLQSRDNFASFLGMKDISKREEETFGKPEEGSYSNLIMNPPTSQELKETATKNISEKITGDKEYLEPKNDKEKALGEFNQDMLSFFMPGTGQLRLAVRVGAPIAGAITEHGLKYLGVSEEKAKKAKMGVSLMTTLAGQSNPGQFASQRIDHAKNMVPQNMTMFSQPFNQSLTQLNTRLNRGIRVPSKSKAVQGIRDLRRQVDSQGRINMHSMMDARDNINEWIAEAGGWDVPVAVRDPMLRNLNELKTNLIDSIETNLNQRLPQAAELYNTGYEAAAVNHRSNAISNFIEKNFGRKVASAGAKLLFPSLATGAAIVPKTAGVLAASYPFYKTGQVLYRVGNSPTLARYYANVIQASLQGNVPSMVANMVKLDTEMAKEEKKPIKGRTPGLDEFKERFKKKG